MELVDLIGSIGFILTMFVIFSPFPSLLEGIKKREIKNVTIEYILIGAAQGSLWLLYGYKLSEFYVKLTNIFVVGCYLVQMNILLYINQMMDKLPHYNGGFAVSFLAVAYLIPGSLCLSLAALISTGWQLTTLPKTKEALMNKDASFINFTIASASLVVFSFWSVYSLMTSNYIMLIPNVLGALVFSTNLIIYYWACNKLPDDFIAINIYKRLFMLENSSTPNPNQPMLNLGTTSSNYNKL